MGMLCDSVTTRLNCCELHGGHLGIKHMKSLVQGIVWWLKLDEEIDTTIPSCFLCPDKGPLNQSSTSTLPIIHGIDYTSIMQLHS